MCYRFGCCGIIVWVWFDVLLSLLGFGFLVFILVFLECVVVLLMFGGQRVCASCGLFVFVCVFLRGVGNAYCCVVFALLRVVLAMFVLYVFGVCVVGYYA